MYKLILQPLEIPLSLITGALMIITQVVYLKNIFSKIITPSILSWFGWTLLMGTTLFSQIINDGWKWNLTALLLSTFGCATIGCVACAIKNFALHKRDWWFLIAGLSCLGLYTIFKNSLLTTIFAIIADLVLGIPTLIKAYKHPKTEKSYAWNIGLVSWSITLITCLNHEWVYALFPIYLFLFTATILLFTTKKRIIRTI